MSETQTFPHASCLVMAASRRGVDDPVAQLQGLSHKCLVKIDGQVMLERVLEALVDSGCFSKIHVSVDRADILRATPMMAGWVDEGRVVFIQSHGNLADSVLKAVAEIDNALPLVITTGDNALHTPDIVRDFVRDFHSSKADGVVGFTSDWLFPPEQNRAIALALLRAGKRVSYAELATDLGHDSFLLESPQIYDLVRGFLN